MTGTECLHIFGVEIHDFRAGKERIFGEGPTPPQFARTLGGAVVVAVVKQV